MGVRHVGVAVGPGIYAPLVDLEDRVGPLRAPVVALVDSGADLTQVPANLLTSLGIDYAALPVVGSGMGAGSSFEIRRCEAELWFERWKICDRFLVSPAGNSPFAMTGRYDFFQRFTVFFDWSRRPPIFDLTPVSK